MNSIFEIDMTSITSVLSAEFLPLSFYPEQSVSETARRFTYAASLLDAGRSLGIQFAFRGEALPCVSVFSDGSAAFEDYQWIFENVANVKSASAQEVELPCEHYALSYSGQMRNLDALLPMLTQARAVLHVLVRAEGNGKTSAGILLALPEKMTLRLRTALAMNHLTVAGETTDVTGFLADWRNALSEKVEIKIDDMFDADEKIISSGSWVPLEDIDLSIRSYNCLKRAGIHTVEELRALSDEELNKIRNLDRKCIEEIHETISGLPEKQYTAPRKQRDYAAMLENLVGLQTVKAQVKRVTAFAAMCRAMSDAGRKAPELNLSMVFVGNPGTAKTTVARIMVGLLAEMDIVFSGVIVEVGHADLIARYEGQTADKVRKVFETAKGRVLFIDEAHTLLEEHKGEYGDEAINTIVQEMENSRSETVVIFAGYPKEMEEFLDRNPGLRSRVPFHIRFEDYSLEEMAQIAALEASGKGFTLHPDAEEKLQKIFRTRSASAMGNGRFCRNLVEDAILSYAERSFGTDGCRTEADFVLWPEDFTSQITGPAESVPERRIGFCA